MNAINAMITQASTSRTLRQESANPKFCRRRSYCEAAPRGVNSKKHRDFATTMTPSNPHRPAADRRKEINRKQKAAT